MREFIKRSGLVGVALCLFLTGCGEELWTMTPEEESLIVAFASGAVAKNNKYLTQGLTYSKEEPQPEEQEPAQEPADTPPQQEQGTAEGPVGDEENPGGTAQTGAAATLAEAMGLAPATAEYHGYQLMDNYLEGGYFALRAQEGNQLIVLSIGLANPTQQPAACDNAEKNISGSLVVNGDQRFEVMQTPLANDFISYSDTLEPGEAQDTILFFEAPRDVAEQISSLAVELERDGVVYHVNLQQ